MRDDNRAAREKFRSAWAKPLAPTAKLSKHAHSAFAMQLRWKLTDQFGWEFQKFDRPGALP